MGKYTKHIDTGELYMIGGEEFKLKGLGSEYAPHFFKIMKLFSGLKPGDKEETVMEILLNNIDDESSKKIAEVIDATLKKSYPDEPVDEMKQFGLKHMMELLPKIMEINSAHGKDTEKLKKIQKIKELRQKKEDVNSG